MSISDYKPAVLWRRIAAMVYDFLLVVALSLFYFAIAVGINVAIHGVPEQGQRVEWGQFKFIVFVGWIYFIIFFFCFFWNKSGQTLGMKTWHLKTFNNQNQFPSYREGFIRCLIAPFSLLLFGIGYWWMFTNPERQTFHEKMSGTRTFLIK
jgi:uncharacterized RDD family membrane protein YckC